MEENRMSRSEGTEMQPTFQKLWSQTFFVVLFKYNSFIGRLFPVNILTTLYLIYRTVRPQRC